MSQKTKYVIAAIILIVLACFLFSVRQPDRTPVINTAVENTAGENAGNTLRFRNSDLLMQHYEKHGKDMGFSSAEEYEKAAAAVPADPSVLHKTEKDDGDDVYYIKETNEFVVVSTDGYIRTYFLPESGIRYFNKQ